jgi:hypothetical protein
MYCILVATRLAWSSGCLQAPWGFVMLLRVLIVFLAAASAHGAGAQLVSSFHIDLDDCDDVAASSGYLYFACHSTHEPGKPPANPANMDGWVAKLERRTGKLVYLAKLGGEGYDIAVRIKVDSRGHAYVVGFTGSQDFPTTPGALQRAYGGGASDAVLVEIGPDGQILYSTFVGGSQGDQGNAIALLRNGGILIGGRTWSADFPGAKQRLGPRGKSDVFLASVRPDDSREYSSMILGGSNDEKLTGIAIWDKSVFATGYTESADFPTARPLQAKLNGPSDAFLVEIRDEFETLNASTYFGGSSDDSGWGISVDRHGNPVVAGITESDDLAVTSDATQPRRRGQADAFLMKVNQSGQKLLFSTYYGGSGLDHAGYDGTNVVVSRTGTIWMIGLTNSHDLTVPGGNHPHYGGGEQDGFLAAFSRTGKICYGTYTGGTARYLLEGVALADDGDAVYAVGTVIRPTNRDSPRPDPKEQYGMFVIELRPKGTCR